MNNTFKVTSVLYGLISCFSVVLLSLSLMNAYDSGTQVIITSICIFLFFSTVIGTNGINIYILISKKNNFRLSLLAILCVFISILLILFIPPQVYTLQLYRIYFPIIDHSWSYIFTGILSFKNIFLLISVLLSVLYVFSILYIKKHNRL